MSQVLNSGSKYVKIGKEARIKKEIPSGVYELKYSQTEGPFLAQKSVLTDSLVDIPGSESDMVLDEIDTFIDSGTRARFEKYGMVYKKGILLYGKPGTGKTVTIIKVVGKLIESRDAIVIMNPDPGLFKEFLDAYSDLLTGRLICLVAEEFEEYYNQDQVGVLSMLDGEFQLNNFITLACTNYIERLPERIKSRPSRFSSVLEVKCPSTELRREFIKRKIHSDDMNQLEALVDSTEGFTLDQIKQVITDVFVYLTPLHDSVLKLKGMSENSIGEEDARSYTVNNHIRDIQKEINKAMRGIAKGPLKGV